MDKEYEAVLNKKTRKLFLWEAIRVRLIQKYITFEYKQLF